MEEDLTLEELMVTYTKILENRNEHMEFSAKIAGVEVKSSGKSGGSQPPKESSLIENLRKAKEKDLQSAVKNNKSASFSDGVGYRVI